jgi:peptidoglycan/xylan/chitin deacetylase (PgdA/CDA1 family)
MIGREPDPTCVVLYYHSIPDIHQKAFADQLDIIAGLTEPISIERVPGFLPGKRYSAVTFDDGFEDTIHNAVPELRKRGIPATAFVTAAYMGQCARWWPESSPERQQKIASVEKWQQFSSSLNSVGSHTITHPYLTSLDEEEARRELSESRKMLEELLKREISTLSFPYGDFNAKLIDWCRDAGYKRVFSTMPGNAFRNQGEFLSGRVKVEPTDWPIEFRLKLMGAYRWLPYAISWKRRILSHST